MTCSTEQLQQITDFVTSTLLTLKWPALVIVLAFIFKGSTEKLLNNIIDKLFGK